MGRFIRSFALRLTLIYAMASTAWILGSDRIVEMLFPDNALQVQSIKGVFFVLATSVLIYVLISRFEQAEKCALARARKAQRTAEAASRAKSVFLSHMSHELRTPLNAIVGFSEIMQAEMFGPVGSERYKGYVDAIKKSSSHLAELLGDIIDLSQIEAGEVELGREDILLASEMQAVADMFRQAAVRKGIALLTDFEEGIHLHSSGVRLRQVIANLVSNAVRHTDQGHVRIATRREGARVVIEVSDTGPGMQEHQLETLRTFIELGNPSYDRNRFEIGNTGLGLVICSRLVRLLGGELEIGGAFGAGTKAFVRLPA